MGEREEGRGENGGEAREGTNGLSGMGVVGPPRGGGGGGGVT